MVLGITPNTKFVYSLKAAALLCGGFLYCKIYKIKLLRVQ